MDAGLYIVFWPPSVAVKKLAGLKILFHTMREKMTLRANKLHAGAWNTSLLVSPIKSCLSTIFAIEECSPQTPPNWSH